MHKAVQKANKNIHKFQSVYYTRLRSHIGLLLQTPEDSDSWLKCLLDPVIDNILLTWLKNLPWPLAKKVIILTERGRDLRKWRRPWMVVLRHWADNDGRLARERRPTSTNTHQHLDLRGRTFRSCRNWINQTRPTISTVTQLYPWWAPCCRYNGIITERNFDWLRIWLVIILI